MKHQNKPFPFAINFKTTPICPATLLGAAWRAISLITAHSVVISHRKLTHKPVTVPMVGLCSTMLRTAHLRGFLLWHKLLFLSVNIQCHIIQRGFTAETYVRKKSYTNYHRKFRKLRCLNFSQINIITDRQILKDSLLKKKIHQTLYVPSEHTLDDIGENSGTYPREC